MENRPSSKTPINKINRFEDLLATFPTSSTFHEPTLNISLNKTESNFQQCNTSTYHHLPTPSALDHQPTMTISQQTTSNFTNEDLSDTMTVKHEQLEKLANSEKIREFLKDDTLREIMYNIDKAARGPEVDNILDATRRNDEMFFNFTEEILNLVLPQDSDF
ncbi:hypothetical protein Glove_321g42 [Diversispora epigaea]|uniref:Uncharacterized protein n=1 Tax=Diversispora epigaea TaxID=1348612 RepID=A0A397HU29_9GLOM|nr:hypothetical protein Glove_321g42 [Diversispora epigaea]